MWKDNWQGNYEGGAYHLVGNKHLADFIIIEKSQPSYTPPHTSIFVIRSTILVLQRHTISRWKFGFNLRRRRGRNGPWLDIYRMRGFAELLTRPAQNMRDKDVYRLRYYLEKMTQERDSHMSVHSLRSRDPCIIY